MRIIRHPENEGVFVEGDCIKWIEKNQSTKKFSLIVVDPPYGIGYHSNYYKGKNPHSPISGDWNFAVEDFMSYVAGILSQNGAVYIFSRWDVSPNWMAAIQSVGLKVKTVISWVKNNWSAGDLKGSYGSQYEQIIFAVKGRHILSGKKRYPNVWNFDRIPPNKLLHPTQKPVRLIERIIECSSGDSYVFDPMAGSGTTGMACKKLGVKYVLCENDLMMSRISRKRLGFDIQPIPKKEKPQWIPDWPDWERKNIHPEELIQLRSNIENYAFGNEQRDE